MKRIYHPYWLWEDYKAGFYDNISGRNKVELGNYVIELFSNPELTEVYMSKVIQEWKYSCEHNLTNISLNRIAYLGQAACCLYKSIPSTITMEYWNKVDKTHRDKADEIAKLIIEKWEVNHAKD
jgi:hypothetical protein